MKKPFIGVYNLANCVTMLGVAAAVVGISFAGNPRFAMLMLILAGVCDMFDGRVARMFPRTDFEKKYGIQLDSFADTVSFVIFPSYFTWAKSLIRFKKRFASLGVPLERLASSKAPSGSISHLSTSADLWMMSCSSLMV